MAQAKQIIAIRLHSTVPKRKEKSESHFFSRLGTASRHQDVLALSSQDAGMIGRGIKQ
jgi:hypothetical protein